MLRHIPSVAKINQTEIKRGMEQAARRSRKPRAGGAQQGLAAEGERPAQGLLESGINVDENATVVVRSTGKSSRSLVKTDDTGTIILIGPPHLRLTARDKAGKLLFDGEIETASSGQSAGRLVERVEPLINKESVEPTEPEKREPVSTP
jgi:hypothetical protein